MDLKKCILIVLVAYCSIVSVVKCTLDTGNCYKLFALDHSRNKNAGRIGLTVDGYGQWALDSDDPGHKRGFSFHIYDQGVARDGGDIVQDYHMLVIKSKGDYFLVESCADQSLNEPYESKQVRFFRVIGEDGNGFFKICDFKDENRCWGRGKGDRWIYMTYDNHIWFRTEHAHYECCTNGNNCDIIV